MPDETRPEGPESSEVAGSSEATGSSDGGEFFDEPGPSDATDDDDAAAEVSPEDLLEPAVQRELGERRRRRVAERAGQVDLDATMSHWPVVEPPTAPRPVVRPARPTVDGVATGPVLPPPGKLVVGALLEARRAEGRDHAGAPGSRRARRRGTSPGPQSSAPTPAEAAVVAALGPAVMPAPMTPTPDAPAHDTSTAGAPARDTSAPPAAPGDRDGTSGRLPGWAAGRRGILLLGVTLAVVLLLVWLLVAALGGTGTAGAPVNHRPVVAGEPAAQPVHSPNRTSELTTGDSP